MKQYLLLLLVLLAASKISTAQVNSCSSMHDGFIKNAGQVVDQKGKKNPDVKFLYAGGNFNVALKENGFSYEGFSVTRKSKDQSEAGIFDSEDEYEESISSTTNRVDVIFKGANSHPVIISEQPSEAVYNYYLAHLPEGGILSVPAYYRITYQNLYKGIDIVFSFNPGDSISKIEYSFVVHPGANAADIKMQYNGANGILLSGENDLSVITRIGEVKETGLKCFVQETTASLPIKRKIVNNIVGFETAVSSNQTIVIDPNIIWGSYYGGEGYDYVGEVTYDKANKVIIGGYTESSSNIATSGAFQTTFGGGTDDVFVAKFKDTGKMEWATYLGGSENDIVYTVTTDKNNNIIAGGKSQSGTEITTPGAYDEDGGEVGDFLLAKFTKKGLLTWCTLLGGEAPEHFRSVICDSKGNIYGGGYTESATGVKVSNKNPSVYQGGGDGLVAKFSPNGFPSWTAYIGGAGQDRFHGVAFDQFGNLYAEGTTESTTGLATPGAFQTEYGGISDAFLAKLDSTGNELWSTYYGGIGDDHGRGVVCNGKSSLYIAGYGSSPHTFGTPGVWQKNINNKKDGGGNYGFDGFVAKFSYAGDRQWGSYYGGKGADQVLGIDIDDSAHVYAGGVTSSFDSIALPNAFQPYLYPNSNDGFFGKFDTTGKLLYATYFGGASNERMEDITSGNNNNLYLAITTGNSMPITPGVWQTVPNGGQECSIYRFNIGDYCKDIYEPNDNKNNSKSLAVSMDTTLYGFNASIASALDQDWFKVKTLSGQPNLKIIITDLPKNYTIGLYNSMGNLIASSVPDGPDQVVMYNTGLGATYFFNIEHDNLNFDAAHCYRIKVWNSETPFLNLVGPKQFNLSDESSDLCISLYPNPVSRELSIKGSSSVNEPAVISIYNVMNEIVYREKINLRAGLVDQKIELPALSAGTYVFEWKQKGAVHHEKIVVQ